MNLGAYTRWMLSQPLWTLLSSVVEVRVMQIHEGPINCIVLHRDGRFQTEMFSGVGPAIIPTHAHPHIESLECMLVGELSLKIDGFRHSEKGWARIRRGAVHGARIIGRDTALLSFQHWSGDVPLTSTIVDWVS